MLARGGGEPEIVATTARFARSDELSAQARMSCCGGGCHIQTRRVERVLQRLPAQQRIVNVARSMAPHLQFRQHNR